MDFALILLTLLNIIIIFLLLKRKTDHSAARFDAGVRVYRMSESYAKSRAYGG